MFLSSLYLTRGLEVRNRNRRGVSVDPEEAIATALVLDCFVLS